MKAWLGNILLLYSTKEVPCTVLRRGYVNGGSNRVVCFYPKLFIKVVIHATLIVFIARLQAVLPISGQILAQAMFISE